MEATAAAVGNATLGALFGQLLAAVIEAIRNVPKFNSSLSKLKETLDSLEPKIQEIEGLNKDKELREFKQLLWDGREHVQKCIQVKGWEYRRKNRYSEKLRKTNESIDRFVLLNLQVDMSINIKNMMIMMKEFDHKIDQLVNRRRRTCCWCC